MHNCTVTDDWAVLTVASIGAAFTDAASDRQIMIAVMLRGMASFS
jgi:hypothetical protein